MEMERIQDVARLVDEGLLVNDEKPHQLALGQAHPQTVEMGKKTRNRHPALVVQGEHVTAQLRSDMAAHSRRRRRHQVS